MKNGTEPIKAAPTARGGTSLDGMRNILEDALYEMGYDGTLTDILIESNIIDFSVVDYTSDVKYQLQKHYGESILWDNSLEELVVLEGLELSLTEELGRRWRASDGNTFQDWIRHVITDPLEKLGMKVVTRYELVKDSILPEELERVKRHLAVDYEEFNAYLPHVNLIIYTPKNFRIIAVIVCEVNLKKQRIFDMAYWKLKLQADKDTTTIKYYLVTADIDGTLKASDLPRQIGRSIIEVDLDGTYVLTAEALEESDKVKLFEHFIDDFKQLLEEH
ncbi:MAG: BsaWI family type II restriction enzyme [Candidatus Poribacteria bacterium]|nr:BsaWI family type II restriction enzyme [Candidatus Poribacteria bacterium]